ncbi:retrovirus-related pol polyprotein from transposon gypsy [Plakobranchus ocellatus]|uniref:Retrovirus-related pol polyprotein from transposon gypsy n=1 Tax=Plakobranchus ocellatus TaxID=259542 RepID=A0AAV4D5N6_9GAST|nr:retrovirus-related pol polyprotein from transposon gypsy [Plakobranchus ocellatus]
MVAQALLDIYSWLGVPVEVFSDKRTQFMSDCMREICRLLGINDHPGSPTLEKHRIDLSSKPVQQCPYPVLYPVRQTLCDELEEVERLVIIKKSRSPYAFPIDVVKKRDDSIRICMDNRRLNKLGLFDPHPMISPVDLFQGMENDKSFSKIDLRQGYWQTHVR